MVLNLVQPCFSSVQLNPLVAKRQRASRKRSICVAKLEGENHSQSNRVVSNNVLVNRRVLLSAATVLLFGSCSIAGAGSSCAELEESESAGVQRVYFGNGCFWGRQKEFVDLELNALGRSLNEVSSVAGYAGGPYTASDGRVCYYYAPPETLYERLGHAEVVGVELRGTPEEQRTQLREFARLYFKQFRRSPFGMMRQDPQDEGPGYRNVIGIPGGMNSSLMAIVQEENRNNMEMLAGKGNLFGKGGNPSEDDVVNRVYVMDSRKFGFHPAEVYHQFHNGLGKAFPKWYTGDLKRIALDNGIIRATGCPENPFSSIM